MNIIVPYSDTVISQDVLYYVSFVYKKSNFSLWIKYSQMISDVILFSISTV